MADSKTIWITLDTQIYYPQVFEVNRDKGDMHSETQGVTKVTLKLTDAQIEELKSVGVPATQLGYQTFKDVTIEGENFRAMTVKRPWVSKYLKDDVGEAQFVGAPMVFDFNKALAAWKESGSIGRIMQDHKTQWVTEDGLLGNGTKAKVKLSIYRGTNKAGKPTCVVQLEEIAIVDLVAYEGTPRGDGEVSF